MSYSPVRDGASPSARVASGVAYSPVSPAVDGYSPGAVETPSSMAGTGAAAAGNESVGGGGNYSPGDEAM